MIEKTRLVRVPVETAFRVWTERIGLWWPPGHRMSGSSEGRMQLEPGVGGRLIEHGPDGTIHEYGVVLEWEPPTLLKHSFYPGTGRDQPTEVEVRFVEVDEGCRVEVRHRAAGSARFEETAVRFEKNWPEVLASFEALLP